MTFRPDYGLRLLRDGVSRDLDLFFYDFKLYSLDLLGPGQYSTMVEGPYAGEQHALSLDFDEEQLAKILSKAPDAIRLEIMAQIAADRVTPRMINFEGVISFAARARLGQLQKVQGEDFVPLIAIEIL